MRFYFFADELERALDRLALAAACRSGGSGRTGDYWAERIAVITDKKDKLNALWVYLNSVVSAFGREEKEFLKKYAAYRGGGRRDALEDSLLKRVAVKFKRRAVRIENFKEELRTLKDCYCLIAPP